LKKLGASFFQLVYSSVLTHNVVTNLRISHGIPHAFSRLSNCVAP
jgi:hypothetical protein